MILDLCQCQQGGTPPLSTMVPSHHSVLGLRISSSTIALPLTPLQPATNATLGAGGAMTQIRRLEGE